MRQTLRIYIKEWPNRAATLYTEAGEELSTFPSLEQALARCAIVAPGARLFPPARIVAILRPMHPSACP